MKRRNRIGIKLIPVFCLLPVGGIAADLDPSILYCRDVEPVVRRAECYDQAVDRLLGKTTSTAPVIPSTASQDRPATVTRKEEAVTPESVFGKSQRETTRILSQDRLRDEDLDTLSGKVAAVTRDGLGRLTVVLENKQVWVQTDTTELNLLPGDAVRINRGFMNSYLLEKQSGSRLIRVRRSD